MTSITISAYRSDASTPGQIEAAVRVRGQVVEKRPAWLPEFVNAAIREGHGVYVREGWAVAITSRGDVALFSRDVLSAAHDITVPCKLSVRMISRDRSVAYFWGMGARS